MRNLGELVGVEFDDMTDDELRLVAAAGSVTNALVARLHLAGRGVPYDDVERPVDQGRQSSPSEAQEKVEQQAETVDSDKSVDQVPDYFRMTAREIFEIATDGDDEERTKTQARAWEELYRRGLVDGRYGDVYDEKGDCINDLKGSWVPLDVAARKALVARQKQGMVEEIRARKERLVLREGFVHVGEKTTEDQVRENLQHKEKKINEVEFLPDRIIKGTIDPLTGSVVFQPVEGLKPGRYTFTVEVE